MFCNKLAAWVMAAALWVLPLTVYGVSPKDTLAARLEKKYGPEFLPGLKKLGCTPQRYVYALKLTKLGLDKLVDAEYGDALFLFKKAYGIVKSPNLLFYQGMTFKGMGRLIRARQLFGRFLVEYRRWSLTRVVKGRITRARSELKRIEAQLARLHITSTVSGVTVRINGERVGKTPLKQPLWLLPGRARVSLTRLGYVERHFSLTLAAGARLAKEVTMITEEARNRANRLKVELRERRKAALVKKRLEYDAAMKKYTYRKRIFDIIGWSAVAAGGVALLASGYYGLRSLGPTDAVESAPRDTPWLDVKSDYETAESYKTNARILGIAGGVITAVGVVITLYSAKFLHPDISDRVTLSADEKSLYVMLSTSF